MKILHTSDWHLGHILYTYDRSLEQRSFLKQLTDIVRRERPDAMLVSGDIFHTSTPSATVQKMYADAMVELHLANPHMTIVVIAGNHDSSAKLESIRTLWTHFNVHVIGSVDYIDGKIDYSKHIIPVISSGGDITGYVIAVPYIYYRNFPTEEHGQDEATTRRNSFFHRLLTIVKERNTQNVPVALMAHLAVSGCDITGHNEDVGGMETAPTEELGNGYDYLALGHIHCPQELKTPSGYGCYCGSPLPVSFDEPAEHHVVIADMSRERPPVITRHVINNPMPLITVPYLPATFGSALKSLEKESHREGYFRLNVKWDSSLPPSCEEIVAEAMKGKRGKFCYIKITREEMPDNHEERHLTISEIKELSPIEIAREYYRQSQNMEMDAELERMFNDALSSINSDID